MPALLGMKKITAFNRTPLLSVVGDGSLNLLPDVVPGVHPYVPVAWEDDEEDEDEEAIEDEDDLDLGEEDEDFFDDDEDDDEVEGDEEDLDEE